MQLYLNKTKHTVIETMFPYSDRNSCNVFHYAPSPRKLGTLVIPELSVGTFTSVLNALKLS